MEREKQARKRFADKKWDGMEPMIAEYAAEAIKIARSDYHEELGDTAESVDRLERILNRLCPAPDPLPSDTGEWMTLLWGSYFGQLLQHLLGGEQEAVWTMTLYPGSDFAVPTLEVAGSRLYPMMKVHRRLSLGASESLPAFYSMLSERLPAARKPGEQR